ncbi:hypothetical protein ECE50_002420 [Chitinophaga sp. Mgbs1]|uniref:O-methyltransferase C-terminal domain-containing protein n=1 Tax=Chitinophaga solisilvae TaxID=1233460 RepID=A0A433WQ84_9BACT|nr:hypothetical protein [Chitinophaga solisilvae]
MNKDSRLLIIESVITPANIPHGSKLMDMNMFMMTGGQERTAAEFAHIIQQAGLRLTKRIDLSVSGESILEVQKV